MRKIENIYKSNKNKAEVAKGKSGRSGKSGKQFQKCKTKQKTANQAHTKPPEHPFLDLEIKISKSCTSCKSCKSGKRQKWQKWHKQQNVAKVQNKTKSAKPSANKSSRTQFSRCGDNDLQS